MRNESKVLSEDVLTIAEAAKHAPGRPNVRTMWRWLERGVRGHILESALAGGRRVTSKQAIERFLGRINAPEATAATRQRQQAISRANRELDAAGV